jgi:hypothetical protein
MALPSDWITALPGGQEVRTMPGVTRREPAWDVSLGF